MNVTWNDTLSVNLSFLEADHEVNPDHVNYTRRATIPLSVNLTEISNTSPVTNSFHIITHRAKNVFIAQQNLSVALELPASNTNRAQTTYYYIPFTNLNAVKCGSAIKLANISGANMVCHEDLPPFLITFEANYTGEEAST